MKFFRRAAVAWLCCAVAGAGCGTSSTPPDDARGQAELADSPAIDGPRPRAVIGGNTSTSRAELADRYDTVTADTEPADAEMADDAEEYPAEDDLAFDQPDDHFDPTDEPPDDNRDGPEGSEPEGNEPDGSQLVDVIPPVKNPAADEPAEQQPVASTGKGLVGHKVGRLDELFRGWENPSVVIAITGELHGYIEPCGCAGKENQKGGLSRRQTFFKFMREKKWPIVPLDLGGQIRRFGPQTDVKFHSILDGLRTMRYDAIALGSDDLRLPEGELLAEQDTFVCANVDILLPLPRQVVIERGGHKIGVTAVFGEAYRKLVNNDAVTFEAPVPALKKAVAELKAKQCDFMILLAHAPRDESLELARAFPEFSVVVTAGGAAEPPFEPALVDESDQWLVEIGHKGMYVGAIGLFDNSEQPVRYERVPLDARFKDSVDMTQLLANYQDQLMNLGLAGLDVRPQSHPQRRVFAGSLKCGECHTKAMEVFENTPHAHALDTLVNLDPPRHFDPECLSCHVTGWDPQRFVPFKGGYLDLEKTPHLAHNGCENCHGPGAAHVAVEEGAKQATAAERDALRADLRLTIKQADQKCRECHDSDNSPSFNFDDPDDTAHPIRYWPKVEHHGKD
ncbi:MAG: multiheme c-type cytochrome [Pirellulales bacterium]